MHLRGRASAALVAGAALVAALSPAASARQMTVKDEPTVTGLEADAELKGCSRQRKRFGGELVAVFRICAQWYRLDPEVETDPDNDYGALWVRATVDARNGWCTRQMKVDTTIPEGGTLSKGPRPGKTVSVSGGTKKVTSRLTVDAEGLTETPGEIKQSFLVRKGTLRVRFKPDASVYRVKWDGSSSKLVAAAKGIELVWPSDGEPWVPAQGEGPGISARFRKTGGC